MRWEEENQGRGNWSLDASWVAERGFGPVLAGAVEQSSLYFNARADSDSVGLGWGWRFCVSERLPGDAGVVDTQTLC